MLMEILRNKVVIAALAGWLIGQTLKFPLGISAQQTLGLGHHLQRRRAAEFSFVDGHRRRALDWFSGGI